MSTITADKINSGTGGQPDLGNIAAAWLKKITLDHDDQAAPHESTWTTKKNLNNAVWFLGAFQVFLLILFGTCTGSEVLKPGSTGTGVEGYNMFIGVEIMMFIGFGYLMTFLKWYGLGAVGFTMLVTAIGLQYYVFAESFFDQAYNGGWNNVDINIYSLLNALYGISAVLISFGALIGKISPIQLVVMTVIELTLHAINYKVFLTGILKVSDNGGTYLDHMFGAYFGLAVAYVLGPPVHIPDMGTVPDLFSLLGTLFLWVYWPSFVAGAAEPNSAGQQRAIVNTILALAASTMGTFWASSFLSTNDRFRPVDIQNATLAGGVAIGTIANLTLSPFGAVIVGLVCGGWSTFGFNVIMPILEEEYKLHDTCGVHNLHGMPSIIGALASIILAAYKGANDTDSAEYPAEGSKQWWHQLLGMLLCISFAIFTGIITGYILKAIDPVDVSTKQVIKDEHFRDDIYWDTADDFHRTLYSELLKLVENDPQHGHLSQDEVDKLKHGVEDLSGHGGRHHHIGDNALHIGGSNHSGHGQHKPIENAV